MDLACRLGCRGALDDGPGPGFHFSGRQESLETQQLEPGFDETVQAGFRQSFHFQVFLGLVFRQFGDFFFHLGGNHDHLGVFLGGIVFQGLYIGIAGPVGGFLFRHIGHVQDGFGGQQVQFLQAGFFIVGHLHPAHRDPFSQGIGDPLEQGSPGGSFLVPGLDQLLGLHQLLFHAFQISQAQFRIDDFHVPDRIDGPFHMGDVPVFKAADHFRDGIGLPDMGQEFVPQAFPFGSPFHQAGDIHELHARRDDLFGMEHVRQHLQPGIGHIHHTHVGLYGTEWIVGRFGPCFGDGIEQGALAHVGQTHDPHFQIGRTHIISLLHAYYRLLYHIPEPRGSISATRNRNFFPPFRYRSRNRSSSGIRPNTSTRRSAGSSVLQISSSPA